MAGRIYIGIYNQFGWSFMRRRCSTAQQILLQLSLSISCRSSHWHSNRWRIATSNATCNIKTLFWFYFKPNKMWSTIWNTKNIIDSLKIMKNILNFSWFFCKDTYHERTQYKIHIWIPDHDLWWSSKHLKGLDPFKPKKEAIKV